MQTSLCRNTGILRTLFFFTLLTFFATSASAQVNSWISPTSGNWDQRRLVARRVAG